MGVSIYSGTGSNVDIAAILEGGDAFMQRLAAFKKARDAAEKATADLALGKQASEALDEAARIRDEVKATRDGELQKVMVHVSSVKADTQDWAAAQRGAAMATREEAERLLAAAEAKHQEATATLADANARAAVINAKALRDEGQVCRRT